MALVGFVNRMMNDKGYFVLSNVDFEMRFFSKSCRPYVGFLEVWIYYYFCRCTRVMICVLNIYI